VNSRGSSPRAISIACARLGEDIESLRIAAPLLVRSAAALGVGSSWHTADGSIRSPDEPRWFGPPLVPSVTLGVGNNEDPFAAVGCADIGSSYAAPLRVIPHFGQVCEYAIEPQRPVSGHILQDDKSGS